MTIKMNRLGAGKWDWPLVAIAILLLGLVAFLVADLWLPNPLPHV